MFITMIFIDYASKRTFTPLQYPAIICDWVMNLGPSFGHHVASDKRSNRQILLCLLAFCAGDIFSLVLSVIF